MGSPRSFSFSDAGKGPSGKFSPEGLLCVTAKIFLVYLIVMPSWATAAWEGIFVVPGRLSLTRPPRIPA